MTACMYGKTATAAYLLGMGAATRLSDINGDTALHWAAYKGHADLVRLLIYSGVPLHCTDNFGSTPLHLACLSGNLTCVRLLCEKVKPSRFFCPSYNYILSIFYPIIIPIVHGYANIINEWFFLKYIYICFIKHVYLWTWRIRWHELRGHRLKSCRPQIYLNQFVS